MKSQSRTTLSLLLILVSILLGMTLASLVASKFSITIDSPYGLMVSYLVMFGFVAVVSIVLKFFLGTALPRLGTTKEIFCSLPSVLFGLLAIIAWNIATTPLADYIPDYGTEQLKQIMETGIYSVLTAVLLAPFFEEWIFRGLFAGNLKRIMRPLWAVILSALIFALSHVYPLQVLVAFGAGFILGGIYLMTRSIVPSMLVHILYNGFIYFLYTKFPYEDDSIMLDILVPSHLLRIVIWVAACLIFAVCTLKIVQKLR